MIRTLAFTLTMTIAITATAAHADRPKPKLTATAKKTYTDKLREGRKLTDKKQYAQAIAAFEAALVANPDDPSALAELGWTAYLAKDLPKAEGFTRKAIANNETPSIKGAALYNLGLILEARSDQKGAIAAYTGSLVARPNPVVRAKLQKLAPEALAAIDPFAPSAMEGPFASLDAFCKVQPKTEDETPCECKSEELKGGKLAAPFAGVALADVQCRETDHSDNDHGWRFVVARTPAGWFARRLGEYNDTLWCQDHGALEGAKTDQLIPGDAVELAITFKEDGSCIGHSQTATDFDTTSLVVVGIGASRMPSATPPIELVANESNSPDTAYDESLTGPVVVVKAVKLVPAWKDGTLQLTGATKGLDKDEAARRLAPHKLAFP